MISLLPFQEISPDTIRLFGDRTAMARWLAVRMWVVKLKHGIIAEWAEEQVRANYQIATAGGSKEPTDVRSLGSSRWGAIRAVPWFSPPA
jgi:hypothetical protein